MALTPCTRHSLGGPNSVVDLEALELLMGIGKRALQGRTPAASCERKIVCKQVIIHDSYSFDLGSCVPKAGITGQVGPGVVDVFGTTQHATQATAQRSGGKERRHSACV